MKWKIYNRPIKAIEDLKVGEFYLFEDDVHQYLGIMELANGGRAYTFGSSIGTLFVNKGYVENLVKTKELHKLKKL